MRRGRPARIPRLSHPLPGLEVRPVRNGRGLVATRSFRPGQRLGTIGGRILGVPDVWRFWATQPQRGANCIRYDAELYLDPHGEPGQYCNHSCRPNAGLAREGGRLVLRAIRAIRPGDEVTHDYSPLLGADDVWTMRCNCGERNCRGRVRNVAALPARLRRRYWLAGFMPAFIVATLPARLRPRGSVGGGRGISISG